MGLRINGKIIMNRKGYEENPAIEINASDDKNILSGNIFIGTSKWWTLTGITQRILKWRLEKSIKQLEKINKGGE